MKCQKISFKFYFFKKRIKICMCILFGHRTSFLNGINKNDGGWCKRCGFGMFAKEYKDIEKFNKKSYYDKK